ncbi:hypothetical protein B0H19DRAFT_1086451 [Mycena capillaripes]|nr:hypothetical protein B0H19DRAFT_1086443 [Mycena capillaripes]KAJ6521439.1 hypothetical protein B0H19DRAFT_1086451 [Mycena capillaripes]
MAVRGPGTRFHVEIPPAGFTYRTARELLPHVKVTLRQYLLAPHQQRGTGHSIEERCTSKPSWSPLETHCPRFKSIVKNQGDRKKLRKIPGMPIWSALHDELHIDATSPYIPASTTSAHSVCSAGNLSPASYMLRTRRALSPPANHVQVSGAPRVSALAGAVPSPSCPHLVLRKGGRRRYGWRVSRHRQAGSGVAIVALLVGFREYDVDGGKTTQGSPGAPSKRECTDRGVVGRAARVERRHTSDKCDLGLATCWRNGHAGQWDIEALDRKRTLEECTGA